MVLKLIKHEFKYLGRYLFLIWSGIILVALSQRLLWEFRNSDQEFVRIASYTTLAILIFALIALVIITFVAIVMRFYKNMFSGEGYLTFTLPVKTWQIVFAKLITAVLFMLIVYVIIVLIGLSYMTDPDIWYGLRQVWSELIRMIKEEIGLMLPITWALTIFVGLFVSILDFYVAMSIGQLANRNKVMFSIATYIGIYIVKQVISLILSFVFVLPMIFTSTFSIMTMEGSNIETLEMYKTLMPLSLGVSIVFLVVEWFLVVYFCKNKLNLE